MSEQWEDNNYGEASFDNYDQTTTTTTEDQPTTTHNDTEQYQQPQEEQPQQSYDEEGDVDPDGEDDSLAEREGRKLFVGGLDWNTSDQSLHQYFSQFGDVERAFVMYDKRPPGDTTSTKKSRGFGFVVYVSVDSVHTALKSKETTPLSLDNRRIDITVATPKVAAVDPCRLYVSDLGAASEEDVRGYFGQLGEVSAVELMQAHDKTSRGFCFVTMASETGAQAVLAKSDHSLNGSPVSVVVARPKPKTRSGRGGRGGSRGGSRGRGGAEGSRGGRHHGGDDRRPYSSSSRFPPRGGSSHRGDRDDYRSDRGGYRGGDRDSYRGGDRDGYRGDRDRDYHSTSRFPSSSSSSYPSGGSGGRYNDRYPSSTSSSSSYDRYPSDRHDRHDGGDRFSSSSYPPSSYGGSGGYSRDHDRYPPRGGGGSSRGGRGYDQPYNNSGSGSSGSSGYGYNGGQSYPPRDYKSGPNSDYKSGPSSYGNGPSGSGDYGYNSGGGSRDGGYNNYPPRGGY